MAGVHMVPLVSSVSSFEAKVVAARLGSEGIVCELRGNVDGVYPLGEASVLVPAAELDAARDLLLADEVAEALAPAGAEWGDGGDSLAWSGPPDPPVLTGAIAEPGWFEDAQESPSRPWTSRWPWRLAAVVGLVALAAAAIRTFLIELL